MPNPFLNTKPKRQEEEQEEERRAAQTLQSVILPGTAPAGGTSAGGRGESTPAYTPRSTVSKVNQVERVLGSGTLQPVGTLSTPWRQALRDASGTGRETLTAQRNERTIATEPLRQNVNRLRDYFGKKGLPESWTEMTRQEQQEALGKTNAPAGIFSAAQKEQTDEQYQKWLQESVLNQHEDDFRQQVSGIRRAAGKQNLQDFLQEGEYQRKGAFASTDEETRRLANYAASARETGAWDGVEDAPTSYRSLESLREEAEETGKQAEEHRAKVGTDKSEGEWQRLVGRWKAGTQTEEDREAAFRAIARENGYDPEGLDENARNNLMQGIDMQMQMGVYDEYAPESWMGMDELRREQKQLELQAEDAQSAYNQVKTAREMTAEGLRAGGETEEGAGYAPKYESMQAYLDSTGVWEQTFGDQSDLLIAYAMNPALQAEYEDVMADSFGGESRWSQKGYRYLSDEEKQALAYWAGAGKAQEYLEALEPELLERRAAGQKEYQEAAATDNAASGTVMWLGGRVVGLGAAALAPVQAVATGLGAETDANSSLYDLNRMQQNVTSAQSSAWEDWARGHGLPEGTGSILYGVVTSAADSLISSHIGAGLGGSLGAVAKNGSRISELGEWIGLAIMGSEAASNSIAENLQEGMEPGAAVVYALADGGVEILTEKLPMEALFKEDGNTLRYLMSNVLTEGMEEGAGDVMKWLMDPVLSAVTKDKGRFQRAMEAYEQAGLGEREAYERVWKDYIREMGVDALSGALSGGLMAGPQAAMQNVQQRRTGQELNAGGTGVAQDIARMGLTLPEGSEAYQAAAELQSDLESGKKISNKKLGRAWEMLMTELDTAGQETLQNTIGRRMQEENTKKALLQTKLGKAAQAEGRELTARERGNLETRDNGIETADGSRGEILRFDDGDEESVIIRDGEGNERSIPAEELTYNSLGVSAIVQRIVEGAHDLTTEAKNTLLHGYTGGNVETYLQEQLGAYDQGIKEGMTGAGAADQGNGRDKVRDVTQQAAFEHGLGAGDISGRDITDGPLNYSLRAGNVSEESIAQGRTESNVQSGQISKSASYTGLAKLLYEAGKRAGEELETRRAGGASTGTESSRRGTGRVTFDRSVDRGSLQKVQKAQIDTLGAVGKALGVDFVFTQSQARDGRYVGENGSYDRHSHVIRLDVNAGRNLTTDEISKTAIIRTAGHELTHYIEQNAAEGYRQLRNFMMQEYERRGVSFDELVKRQRQSFKLSESQAISEVIADGCEMMLQDTQAVQRLARKNRSLAQTIRDFIDEHIVQALKRAFTGVQAQRREARTLMDTDAQGMQHYAEELQALWDRALEEASAQGSGNIDADVAGNTQKSGNNDDVQYSLRDSEGNEIQIHESELRENKKTVATSTAVATIHEEDYQRFTGGNLVEEGTKYFRELGEKAVNPILGEVHLATSGLRHIVGRNNVSSIKAMTIPAIKPVIEQGQLVGLDERHNGKPIDTGIIAAKVSMPDGPYHVGVVVSQDNGGTRGQSNRYSFHAAYAIKESTAAMDSMEMNSTELPRERSSASVYSILREIAGYNTQSDEVQRSLREEAQTEDITAALQGRNAPLAIGDASGDITDTIPAYTELSATDASEDIVDENGLRDNGISGQNDVQYSLRDSEGNEYRITREEIEKNREEVAWMPVLEGVTGNAFPKMEGSKPSERILAYFQNLGGKAYRSEFGEIRLEKTGAEHFARFINQKTAAVVPLIPDVIENGSVVDVDENHKGTHVPTVSLAAKVAIDGKPYYMGVALRQIGQGDTRYYIHSVYAVNEENGDQLNLKGRAAGESRRPSTDDPHSLYSILQEIAGYNGTSGQNTEDTQYSQRDYEQMSVQDFVSAMAEDTGLREGEKGVLAHYNDLRRQAQSLQEKIAGATVEGQRRTWQRQLDNVNQRLQTMESSQGMVGLMQRARSAMDNLERLQSGQARHSLEEMGEQLGQLSRTMDALKAGNDQQARDILKDFERSYFTDRAKREAAQAIREASGSAMRLEDIEQAVGGIARAWYSHDESTAARAQELAEELMATIDYPNAQGSIGELIREQRGQVSIPVSREGMDYIRERWGSLKEANRQAGGIHVRFVARESVGYGADSAIQELGPDIVDLDAITSENDVIDYFMKAAEDTGFNREAWLTEKGVKDERELIPEVLSKIFEEVTGIQPKAGQLQAASLRGSLQSQSDYLNALTESLEGMREDMRRALKSGRGEMAELEGRLKRGQEDARAVMSYASAMVEENNRVSQSVIRSLESTVKSYEQMVADISGRAAQSYQEKLTWHDTMVANEKLHKSLERTLKRLDRMTRKGTDYDHVPEELRGVATAIMKYVAAFDESHERGLARLVNDRESAADILAQYSRMSVDSSYMDESVLELLEATKAAVDEYANVQGTRGAERAAAYNRAMTHLSQSLETLVGMINAGNEIFMNGRRVQTDRAAGQLEQELRQKKNAYQYGGAFKAIENAGRLFGSGNVTPYYFFKWQGGTLQALHEEFRRGQNAYGLRLDEAKNTIEDIMQRSGYANWGRDAAALQGRNLTFTTTWGENMTLSVEEQMTVLAAWEREHSGKQVLTEHLEKGGIVRLDDKSKTGIRRGVERQGMAVSAGMIEQIRNNLTAEQLQYMHEMVRFLSTTVGGWGNEASMRMFGYRKFTEANYFPFKVWKGAMKQGSNAQNLGLAGGAQTSSPHLVNSGMTKNLQNRASNPLVLQSFTDIVLEHTANMLTYSTMAAPIESMNRVLNVKTTGMMEGDNTAQAGRTEGGIVNEIRNGGTIRTLLAQKLGDNRANWLFNYMRDLQGGMQSDSREKAFDKLLSAFKKGAVSGSLSVSMKQPVSYIRAAYEISPRYLAEAIALPKSHFRDSYSEARQYAGVAAIKDMGRYDTSVGWGTAEWLGQTPEGGDSRLRSLWNGMREAVGYDANGKRLSWRTFADRWDAIAGYLPGKMDELTWNRLWEAVKLEQAAQNRGMDTQSEEFLKKCGERFTEVIDATQVYDSTMSRSDNMRSKSSLMKAMTSFMAEPTVNLNMLADAVISKKPKKMAAAASIYLLSAAVQALITAHFGVIRGDDREKEETYWEKLMDRLGGALGDEVNPLGSIPGASDLYEMLLNGEEVSRSDLTILNDIGKYGAKLMKGDYSGDLHSAYMGVEQLGGSLAKLVGLPTRNVMRDVRALWNWLAPNEEGTWLTGNGAVRENSESTMKLEFVNGWHDTWNNKYVTFYDTSSSAYVQRYYEALKAGRTQEAEELHEYLLIGEKKQEKTIGTQLGTILKKEYSSGSITLEEGLKFSEEHGVWDTEKKAYEALIKAKQKAETEMDEEETEAPSVYRTVFEAMTKDKETFGKAVEELAEHGYEEKNVISQAKSELGKGYREGRYTRTEAENILRDIFEVEEADERYWQIDKWNYQQETGTAEGYSKTGRLQEAMEKGTDKEYRIAKQELTANGYSEKDILSATKGIIKELYTKGTWSKSKTETALKNYKVTDGKNENYWLLKEWDYDMNKGKKDPNFSKYTEIRQAVKEGDWKSFNKAKSELQTYSTAKDEKTNNTNIVTQGISYWKEEYQALRRTDPQGAEKLWGNIAKALEAFGKSRRDIEKKKKEWEKED